MHERHVATFNVPWQVRTVGCVTVDSYCRDRRIAPTFIKIDTEEFEWDVLRGGSEVVHEFKPGLLVEVAAGKENRTAIWEWLTAAGYRCYQILERGDPRSAGRLCLPIRTSSEFAAAATQNPESEPADTNTDFVCLQARDDFFATES